MDLSEVDWQEAPGRALVPARLETHYREGMPPDLRAGHQARQAALEARRIARLRPRHCGALGEAQLQVPALPVQASVPAQRWQGQSEVRGGREPGDHHGVPQRSHKDVLDNRGAKAESGRLGGCKVQLGWQHFQRPGGQLAPGPLLRGSRGPREGSAG